VFSPQGLREIMIMLRIATLCGSLRAGSYNRKLLALAEAELAKLPVEIDHLDLRDFPLPLYDGDIEAEQGLPPEAWKLKARIAAAQGVILVSPEYNGGIPGTLKNAIDWTSRGENQPWTGKVVGLMGATTGMWGTQRMMPQLRQAFQILNAIVISQQINVREAKKIWDENGNLLNPKLPALIEKFAQEFVRTTSLLKFDNPA
jgi:chromate reductase, NAD(P)H dehydrogenase (quinone)